MNPASDGYQISVNRGPNWLFLQLKACPSAGVASLGEQLWSVVSKHFVYRVVLEFGPSVESLTDEVIAQLDAFRQQLESHEGALRVCGLSKKCTDRLEAQYSESKTRSRLTSHATVVEAVFGSEHAPTTASERESENVKQDTAYEALRVH